MKNAGNVTSGLCAGIGHAWQPFTFTEYSRPNWSAAMLSVQCERCYLERYTHFDINANAWPHYYRRVNQVHGATDRGGLTRIQMQYNLAQQRESNAKRLATIRGMRNAG